jgi:CubicO group peptidase (beta-lactamase class C family)
MLLVAMAAVFGAARRVIALDSKLPAEEQARIEAAARNFVETQAVPGLSAAVVQDGEYAWSEGFGMADLENSVPATPKTLYRLGSVSKSLTATGAMLLWEHGKLDLDAPVQKYCPAFPEKGATITTRELLGHLGGIRHYHEDVDPVDDPELGNTKHFDDPIAAGLAFFAKEPLIDTPGAHFHYSTHGYTLVGCAMEGVSGEKYAAYMHEAVLVPGGMAHTIVDDKYAVIPNRTRFYQKDKSGHIENADFLDSSYKIPGGGWLSSADDLAQFEVDMLGDKLVKHTTRDLMWAPQTLADGSKDSYGLGWGIAKADGISYVAHSGGQQGTSTIVLIAPELRAGIVVLANIEDVEVSRLAHEILSIVARNSRSGTPRN